MLDLVGTDPCAQGVGFGMLLGSTPLAMVAYFVLPQVFTLTEESTRTYRCLYCETAAK